MVACLFSGFSGTSSGTNPGTHDMSDDTSIGGAVARGTHKLTYTDEDAAVVVIQAALQADPCQPVVLVGHSLRAD